jgi:uncharacterized membrane protein
MIKTLSFAGVHFTVAFTVAYLLTGSIAVGGLVALVEPLCNTVAYYLHEKAWLRFGRRTARKETRPSTGFGHGHLSGAC